MWHNCIATLEQQHDLSRRSLLAISPRQTSAETLLQSLAIASSHLSSSLAAVVIPTPSPCPDVTSKLLVDSSNFFVAIKFILHRAVFSSVLKAAGRSAELGLRDLAEVLWYQDRQAELLL